MSDNVNINVTENIDQVNIVASEVVEVVDLNLYATTEDVSINVTEEIIQVNINKVQASNVTKTSDLINDGEDGINPFITLNDIPPVEGFVPYTGATQNVDLGEFELRAGQVTLDTSPTGTAAVATTRWNNTLGITETTLKGGSVVLKNGIDLVARVVNKVTPNTTLTKANYTAVRISGAQGQRLAVAYAQANNDLNSADTIGLVCETIPTNQEGFILTVGQLENINTTGSLQGETWNDGDVIYLSPTVAGKLTNIKPTAPQHIVIIGYVEYAHANNGKLYVKIMNGWELEELHNVSSTNYTTPIDTDSVLTYDVTNSLWKRLSWSNIKSNLKTYFDTIYQAALGFTPENVANKSTNTSLGTSDTLYPTQNAVKVYADSKVTDAIVDGVTTVAPSQNAVFDALALKQNTLTNPITGTGASGQVAFFNGTTTQTGDNGLFWDNTNKRLGIGTNLPTHRLSVDGDLKVKSNSVISAGFNTNRTALISIGTSADGAFFDLYSNVGLAGTQDLGYAIFAKGLPSNLTNSEVLEFRYDRNARRYSMNSIAYGTGTLLPISLYTGTNTNQLVLNTNGNVSVGASTAGARLDVRAQGALSTDIAFRVRNSADNANLIDVNGAGAVLIGTSSSTNSVTGTTLLTTQGNSNSNFNLYIKNDSNGSTASAQIVTQVGGTGGAFGIYATYPSTFSYRAYPPNGSALINGGSGGLALLATNASGIIKFVVGGDNNSDEAMRIASNRNVLIGTSTDIASSRLTIESTTQGFLPPRMTTTQRNAIASPAAGLIVYDTTLNKLCVRTASAWETITSI